MNANRLLRFHSPRKLNGDVILRAGARFDAFEEEVWLGLVGAVAGLGVVLRRRPLKRLPEHAGLVNHGDPAIGRIDVVLGIVHERDEHRHQHRHQQDADDERLGTDE